MFALSVKMVKKKFDTPVTHTPEEYDFPDSLYDTCCYTNRDIARHEIRFNFGYFMDDRAGRR